MRGCIAQATRMPPSVLRGIFQESIKKEDKSKEKTIRPGARRVCEVPSQQGSFSQYGSSLTSHATAVNEHCGRVSLARCKGRGILDCLAGKRTKPPREASCCPPSPADLAAFASSASTRTCASLLVPCGAAHLSHSLSRYPPCLLPAHANTQTRTHNTTQRDIYR